METNSEPGSATKQFQCTSCPKSFLHKNSLKYHTLTIHVKDELKSFHCKECLENKKIKKLFATQTLLNTHLRKNHRQPYPCASCEKSFFAENSLKEHILNKHLADECKTFMCSKCVDRKQLPKSFATQAILDKHIKRAHGSPGYKCQVCFRTFHQSSNFQKHLRVHANNKEKNQKCEFCSKPYYSAQDLQNHLLRVHNQKRDNVNYFKCELCTMEFVTRFLLETHVVAKHVVDKAFECPVCSKKFIDQQTVDKHLRRHDTSIKYSCDICSKGFKSKVSFNQHLGVVHKRFFYCIKCLRSFSNKSEFDAHISDSKQQLKCYMCQKTMDSECNLKIHTDSHVSEIKTDTNKGDGKTLNDIEPTLKTVKPVEPESSTHPIFKVFQCELCPKTFDREAYFQAHRVQVHANAEWKCSVEHCSKIFKRYNRLTRHRITHLETKEFVCSICPKAFHFSKGLRDHEQIHLDNKKYKCKQCPKSYVTPFGLRVHMANNHGGPKPVKCPKKNCNTA